MFYRKDRIWKKIWEHVPRLFDCPTSFLIPIGGPRPRSKPSNMLPQRRITICAVIFGLFCIGESPVSCDKEQSRNAALNEPDFEIRKPIQVPFSYFYVIWICAYLYSYYPLSCEMIICHSIVYQKNKEKKKKRNRKRKMLRSW